MDRQKKYLKENLWNKNGEYYVQASAGTIDGFKENLPLRKLQDLATGAESVLDCGCGDGTTLNLVAGDIKDIRRIGVDISLLAAKMAKKKYENTSAILVSDLEELPFGDNKFELVYSAYVLEHLSNPDKVLDEMVRVTAPGGIVLCVSPNFGSPLFGAPGEVKTGKEFRMAVIRSFKLLFKRNLVLEWVNVNPYMQITNEYQMDYDTVCEPYVLTLKNFMLEKGFEQIACTSDFGWKEMADEKIRFQYIFRISKYEMIAKRLLKLLGLLGIPPFKYYGPTLFFAGRKSS